MTSPRGINDDLPLRSATLSIEGVRVTVHTRSMLPLFVRHQALTLGSHIFYRGHVVNFTARLLRHEFEHVKQWRALGMLRFGGTYLLELLRHGYGSAHALERAAMNAAATDYRPFERYVTEIRQQCGQVG